MTVISATHQQTSLKAEREMLIAARPHDAVRRDEVVDAFMPLIGSVAHRYRGARAVDRAELMQEGVVGLLRALDRYDPTLETPFWAYASWWVRQAMQQLVSELTWPVVLSDRALRQLARVKDAQRLFAQDNGREPSPTELAETTGLRKEHLGFLLAAERTPRALHEPVAAGQARGSALGDLLADPAGEDPLERVPPRHAAGVLAGVLAQLTVRERSVLSRRYGLDGPEQTLREIAGTLGVSAERVRQIEQGALEKLRETCDWQG
ncbi:MAG TPA: sigma-70 family RNA polymerase sigma factor [Baekduia sp.]|uniref:sigma-70 family RNA polymerase sigma factor n=1 Tax=Baekduia sp. TaxID=2600305 RepID=UPI002CC1838D|nr:sigma-70 family RNA polymerase sigma factor [Baekduia sp.]HMJ35862.1 sigma-70 family RNA polymerase sigma factor [Baekduia sp.]